ncbi:MAG: hypothetical protein DKM50_01110 [Candidatus Margulisiibacteriota bacterium]|nr:MAG: hypothetical protein A2X43_08205 [Candidatus Margulisbacteria bacterium GWD2_39_127]OGI01643.1 MAG: hypothetical protein A2X42_04780 [Candidatus Margulisbacteria bacterium GWF2_38_17]OGI06901.1 MAG: hypothetical protein A2X41_10485 [Candidatus Margulisbacteria bacterium GWE2_39_32]PZM83871.1 MAG: hypothetical protein DKM50_01110 [Candidatus Margulisiibacteriota bacterium]HAR63606.1 hypothetical protein [Candidatus Margulisiibacteriota bacterium]
MIQNERIDIDYLARVEGETNIRIELEQEPAIELRIFEPPRFFEGFLVGRKFDEVGDIVSRICGICPVSHMTTAILALEVAMNIKVTEQTKIIRRIMSISQIIASHLIHLYMLVMPDYYKRPGIVQMLPDFGVEINRLMKIKTGINELTGLIGGRALHPVTHMPGGFTRIPAQNEFNSILTKLKQIKDDGKEVVKDMAALSLPEFHSDSEYVALGAEDEYAINGGQIISTFGLDIPVADYRSHFEESEVNYARAKYSIIKGRADFATGALSRLNLKFDRLNEETKQLAENIGFRVPDNNPFHNILAQALEVFDGILMCIHLLENTPFHDEERNKVINSGEGGAITEAPRGLLYHWYRVDRKGIVTAANLITPTSHNFLNIENNLRALVKKNLDKDRETIQLLCEKLVRAYDPCFSCSVH